jgi:hypothetical protein
VARVLASFPHPGSNDMSDATPQRKHSHIAPAGPSPAAPPAVSFETVRENPRVKVFVRKADEALAEIGYTEHGERHVGLVAHIAYNILKRLGHAERECELAAIAGYLHDIGNAVNRDHHAQTGAVMAMQLLREFGMPDEEILLVIAAIGNHHENDGDPVNDIAAALILADKSDVHRTRVRNADTIKFDIHDRVNYAVEKSFLNVDEDQKHITLELTLDANTSHMMEYFEIFLSRMQMCRHAAEHLDARFRLVINGQELA